MKKKLDYYTLFRTVLQSLRLPGHVRGWREVNFNYTLPEVHLRRLEGATTLDDPILQILQGTCLYVCISALSIHTKHASAPKYCIVQKPIS
jgi:hypothetical protein